MCVLKKMLFAQAPLLAIAMAIFSFFRIYGASIDRHHGKMQMQPSRLQHLPNHQDGTYEHGRHSGTSIYTKYSIPYRPLVISLHKSDAYFLKNLEIS